MTFSQYKMDKKNCCSCKSPCEFSTARDFCQNCKKFIYIPSYEEYLENKLLMILDKSTICEKGKDVIYELMIKKLKPIFNENDLQTAEKNLQSLDEMIAK